MTSELEARWLHDTVGLRVLDDRLVVWVRGDDARTWLNGQLTNDVRPLSASRAVYGLFLSTKGRILADATAHERAGAVLVDVPRAVWSTLAAHLEKYIIMEDVTLEPAPELTVLTAQGPRAAELLPAGAASDRLRRGGRDVLVETAALEHERSALGAAASALGGGAVSEAGWELARVRAGVPRFGVDFGETVYPHEVGLEKSAVSFQKGCYLGQEVVCMLESRGQISRRLARLESDGALAAGTSLLDATGAEVGQVSSVTSDAEGTHALGLLKRAAVAAAGTLTAGERVVRVSGPA